MMDSATPGAGTVDRRTALTCGATVAAAATLTACGSVESRSGAAGGVQAPPLPAGVEVTATAEVPVGGAVIAGDTVVTQPTAGSFRGFSSTCTHQGCKVSAIEDDRIICRCHGSTFNFDGTVASGPAPRPLATQPIQVKGDTIITA